MVAQFRLGGRVAVAPSSSGWRHPWRLPLAGNAKQTRVPVLANTLLRFTLHTINHLLDIGQAEPSWLGPANALVLGLVTASWRSPSMWSGNRPRTGQPPQQDRRTTTMRSVVAAPAA